MAQFYYLHESKQYLNLDLVSLVTENADGSLIVAIMDREQDEVVSGNEAVNLLARLQALAKSG